MLLELAITRSLAPLQVQPIPLPQVTNAPVKIPIVKKSESLPPPLSHIFVLSSSSYRQQHQKQPRYYNHQGPVFSILPFPTHVFSINDFQLSPSNWECSVDTQWQPGSWQQGGNILESYWLPQYLHNVTLANLLPIIISFQTSPFPLLRARPINRDRTVAALHRQVTPHSSIQRGLPSCQGEWPQGVVGFTAYWLYLLPVP